MIYISTLLPRQYPSDAETLFTALAAHDVPYALLDGTRDVWVRDFMPVRTGSGKLVSFRYEPSYLKNDPVLRPIFVRILLRSLACRLHTAISTLMAGTWCSRRPGRAS